MAKIRLISPSITSSRQLHKSATWTRILVLKRLEVHCVTPPGNPRELESAQPLPRLQVSSTAPALTQPADPEPSPPNTPHVTNPPPSPPSKHPKPPRPKADARLGSRHLIIPPIQLYIDPLNVPPSTPIYLFVYLSAPYPWSLAPNGIDQTDFHANRRPPSSAERTKPEITPPPAQEMILVRHRAKERHLSTGQRQGIRAVTSSSDRAALRFRGSCGFAAAAWYYSGVWDAALRSTAV
ncbi:hypothetical protein BJ912DRAFT_1044580 [Pholiota molesta]|nr:hypothetical protein BJ912DRAFT_1044580 [Pholiota molesta]